MNPVKLAQEIEDRYRRYLETTFYFKDPDLRRSFQEALRSGRLSKGPFLEATPIFRRGATPCDLFRDLLSFQPEQGFLEAVQGDRPLYRHQEESIRCVFEGHNVVVATGTGSGKTEAFLYPILLHLLREFQTGKLCPGVRALVLYPMNALANDQRERLGDICRRLADGNSAFRFTFGQYIGETPENENDSQRHAQDHIARRLPGELVLRSEMRRTPPHILLTNYSMLEYLLLRPDDSPLFDEGRAKWWTFLVLDEAHQYRGSRGIEMAMLLRRLKQRLREGGCNTAFRCIATSATLVGGEQDKSAVAGFATDLFGEPFQDQAVLLGEVESIRESGTVSLDREDYQSLARALEDATAVSEIARVARRLGTSVPEASVRAEVVGSLLQQDKRANELRRLVAARPRELETIADAVFPDLPQAERVEALSALVVLLFQAKDAASGAPLLSARYHLFLRSLEGAFLSFWPDKKVVLERRSTAGTTLFEVGLCRECGQHYLVGREVQRGEWKWREAVRDPGHPDFGASFFLPLENGSFGDEDSQSNGTQYYSLCVQCGEIRPTKEQLRCGHQASIVVQEQEAAREREDQIPRCAVCGYQAPDPVREVVHGTDGPHAVIATTLHQNLPDGRKKVLAFADGRQEAAFFAWYLENSYRDILHRNLLLKVVQQQLIYSDEGSSLKDLVTELRTAFRTGNVFPPATSDLQLRREAWLAAYREFLTDEPRISLEGVGLVRWFLKWPPWFQVPELLLEEPWSFSADEAHEMILVLIDSMRADRAVELRCDAAIELNWNDLGLQAAQMRLRIGRPARPKGVRSWPVRSWDGERGRRVRFLTKFLKQIAPDVEEPKLTDLAVATTREIWDAFRKCDESAPKADDRLLLPVDDARRLNPDWWRIRFVGASDSIYQCDVCGRLQPISIRAVCPRPRCPGSLKKADSQALGSNHYRLLYESKLPGSLRVEEHTAQLDKEKAREFQRDFRADKIHVLSCSTTFELGVDLGHLDTIFLRNVPPEAFNYAQRVGRAGRRSGYPGFAITYCRRGPHDLYHFSEPQRMLAGKVQPPVLALRNEKIVTRHMVAVALSFFFRAFAERFPKVESLFKNLSSPCGVADLQAFLLSNRSQIEETIRRVLPEEMAAQLGLSDGGWINKITGETGRFALAEAEVSSDYKTVVALKESAKSRDDFRTAEWAQRRAETIAKEEVLSFLSRKAVIPKYGFPVDVVELDTQRALQNQEAFEVSLQRDLSIAISEFAPTSKLVANKKEWTSYGLKKVAEKEWPRKLYARCPTHNVFLQWKEGEPEPTLPCGDRLRTHKYVIPQFGFVTGRDKPKEPKARPARVFSTQPYFAGSLASEPEIISLPDASPVVNVQKASPGLMVVLCEGRRGDGFYLCGGCGAGFRRRERSHKTPQGQECHGTLAQVSLGHEFVTDVLQLQFRRVPQNLTDPVWFAFSLAYALAEGAAEVLEVPSVDLSTTVAHCEQHGLPPIILYDNVPGGAGLVARLERENVLKASFEAALKRVTGECGCAENTSCYGCLRNYRNQFAHDKLQRGPVQQYLSEILGVWISVPRN
jgi:ATP-dependent helicase YprA (DUF1998 family)